MESILSSNIKDFDPNSKEHDKIVCDAIRKFKTDDFNAFAPSKLETVDITTFSYEQLESIIMHYSHVRNRSSISDNGIVARIGDNSRDIDDDVSIYFSYGIRGVLDTWDIWFRWRLSQLYSPSATKAPVRPKGLSREESRQFNRYAYQWMDYIATRKYRNDTHKLARLFDYQIAELSHCDYYLLDIEEGKDFDLSEIDPKKKMVIEANMSYFNEIYGVGACTRRDYTMEKWNCFTPLGKEVVIPQSKIKKVLVGNKGDALSVLTYLYAAYLDHNPCPEWALLPKFFA